MSLSQLPAIAADPYGPEAIVDPYPLYEEIRAAGPVVHLEEYGVAATARYEVARKALFDWETFSSARGVGLADLKDSEKWPGLKPSGLVEQDPPNHTIAREAVRTLFAPSQMKPLQEAIDRRANELVADLLEGGRFDAYQDLAHDFVMSIVPDLIGVPEEGRDQMIPFSTLSIQASTSPHNDRIREIMSSAAHLREYIERSSRRENLAPGSMGSKIWDLVDAGQISDELAVKLIRGLLTAGMDTTIYAIVNAVRTLIAFPDQWELLRDDPSHAQRVLDETLRYESVTQTITRTVNVDTEFFGAKLPEGTKFIIFNSGTGRDPERWGERANRFDLAGASRGHLGLGFGIHQCVGQPLARMEVQALFTALATQVRELRAGEGETKLLGVPPLRSWTRFPVEISA